MSQLKKALRFHGNLFYGNQHVALMDSKAEAACLRLMWLVSQRGSIPEDPGQIKKMLPLEASRVWRKIWPQLEPVFPASNGRRTFSVMPLVSYSVWDGSSRSRRFERLKAARALGRHTNQEWLALCLEYGGCARCGEPSPAPELTRDHVVPISLGGSDGIDNIQPLCRFCNSVKGATVADYRRKAPSA